MTKELTKEDINNLIQEGIKSGLKDALDKKSPTVRRKKQEGEEITLRRVDGKFITEIDKKYTTKINPKTKEETIVFTVYLGEEKKKKVMTFDDIRLAERVKFKVAKKNIKKEELIGEPIPVVVHKEWRSEETGEYAENVVVIPHTTYELKTDDGKLLISDNVVNL